MFVKKQSLSTQELVTYLVNEIVNVLKVDIDTVDIENVITEPERDNIISQGKIFSIVILWFLILEQRNKGKIPSLKISKFNNIEEANEKIGYMFGYALVLAFGGLGAEVAEDVSSKMMDIIEGYFDFYEENVVGRKVKKDEPYELMIQHFKTLTLEQSNKSSIDEGYRGYVIYDLGMQLYYNSREAFENILKETKLT